MQADRLEEEARALATLFIETHDRLTKVGIPEDRVMIETCRRILMHVRISNAERTLQAIDRFTTPNGFEVDGMRAYLVALAKAWRIKIEQAP